jgi:tripartite-type tricarboxylate transporter receptor subunit TctC
VGFAPGGGTDIVARALSVPMTAALGQSIVVENKAGAAGTIGADYVAKATPDGYTLLMGHSNSNAISPFVLKNIPYNPATDFTPITYLGYVPNVLVVNVAVPVKDVADVIALASASNAGIDNAAYANKKVLVVNGNSGDSLNLTGGQWVDTGAVTTFNLGGSFSIYQFGNSDIYVVTNLPPVTPP